jgi:exopolysaccharide production protein ExoZ
MGQRIPFIEALRGIAAVQVLLSHVSPAKFGHAWGVDLFFLISGYVMVGASEDTPSPGVFLARRISRIIPLYWLATIAVFVLTLIVPHAFASTKADLLDLIRSLAFIPYVKASGLAEPVLYVGWTLNYEMFFYALFAASLFLSRNVGRLAVVIALVILSGAGFAIRPTGVIAEFYTGWRLLEFALGVGLAAIGGDQLNAILRRIPVGPLATLGAASYAIYLTHPFALGLGRVVLGSGLRADIAIVVGAISAGLAVWTLIDRPMQSRAHWAVRKFMIAGLSVAP